jgi:hypothetical protein
MTIEQTIDIPVNRELHLVLPLSISSGRAKITLDITPLDPQKGGSEQGSKPAGDAELEKIMKEASERAKRERADPGYRQQVIDSFKKAQEGGPIFGGISAEDFKRECNDEWGNRF